MSAMDREKAIRHFSEKYRDVQPGVMRDALVECAMEGYDFAVSQIPWSSDND
jgi:hypothetical protein